MKFDDKVRDKKLQYDIKNTIKTLKQQKYQHCYHKKLINMNILQVKEYYPDIKEE